MLARLRGVQGRYAGKTFEISTGITTIGKSVNNNIVLNEDSSVQDLHATIECKYNQYFYLKYASEDNPPVLLKPGDRVQIGETIFVLDIGLSMPSQDTSYYKNMDDTYYRPKSTVGRAINHVGLLLGLTSLCFFPIVLGILGIICGIIGILEEDAEYGVIVVIVSLLCMLLNIFIGILVLLSLIVDLLKQIQKSF